MIKQIDFLGKRRLAAFFSGFLLLAAIVSLAAQGLQLGIDFTGGTLVEIGYSKSVDLKSMRAALDKAGFDDATVQHFGSTQEVLIRLKPRDGLSNAQLSTGVATAASEAMAEQGDLRRVEFVGPQVGDELTEDGGLALLYSMFGILIYVAWRFEYKFALGSVAALAHDVLITLGFFSILQMEFDLTVLAAVLAVIGYSLNDTIVVYDRIRENFRLLRKGSAEEVMNTSLNQTLSRTIMTSLTTLLVLIALAVLGGEIIHNFAIALTVGVVIGTYSSIFVASPLVLAQGVSKEDLMEPEIEGDDIDAMP
ncbi:preprotein translocase subunit SecF [Bathymodiolus japonicus methanotrophic gill symbiont]|uniref:protein translocase subunit SecF n=1 Tax=Bathymodiolus japonicus methanotrophic gill symbiont TaxID=113269 RepID=UPI001B529276|nr:protein translocase subunit SecF [Bathymodiolus japonicus methanotrophic gill symbiont]GFO72406.1 preprotein translocase subunit SecF [Bathymodiolus japonicus methanotrophic gill symbiont]